MAKDLHAVQLVNWDNLSESRKIEALHDELNRLSGQLGHLLNVIHVRADGNLEVRRNLSVVNSADILLE
jgi:hypothetical protein